MIDLPRLTEKIESYNVCIFSRVLCMIKTFFFIFLPLRKGNFLLLVYIKVFSDLLVLSLPDILVLSDLGSSCEESLEKFETVKRI